jgi:hypothetical protein
MKKHEYEVYATVTFTTQVKVRAVDEDSAQLLAYDMMERSKLLLDPKDEDAVHVGHQDVEIDDCDIIDGDPESVRIRYVDALGNVNDKTLPIVEGDPNDGVFDVEGGLHVRCERGAWMIGYNVALVGRPDSTFVEIKYRDGSPTVAGVVVGPFTVDGPFTVVDLAGVIRRFTTLTDLYSSISSLYEVTESGDLGPIDTEVLTPPA